MAESVSQLGKPGSRARCHSLPSMLAWKNRPLVVAVAIYRATGGLRSPFPVTCMGAAISSSIRWGPVSCPNSAEPRSPCSQPFSKGRQKDPDFGFFWLFWLFRSNLSHLSNWDFYMNPRRQIRLSCPHLTEKKTSPELT